MKLLVFAHTPPPFHGQSYMVDLMIKGFGGDRAMRPGDCRADVGDARDVQCYHVNARISDRLEDIGGFQLKKLVRLFRFCCQAIKYRICHGIDTLYYIPAPAKRSAVLRDWLALALLRPWFKYTIFHWHAFGLGHWVSQTTEYPGGVRFEPVKPPRIFGFLDLAARRITARLLANAAASIVLTNYNTKDAEVFDPCCCRVVPNGIPDPCPDFDRAVLRAREERAARISAFHRGNLAGRSEDAPVFRILFLAHCMEEKGLFDTLEGVRIAASRAVGASLHLSVAGTFLSTQEEERFLKLAKSVPGRVDYLGFVSGEEKNALLQHSDCLCFPTRYAAEGQPVSLIEAAAWGLPCITTYWRGLVDSCEKEQNLFVPPADPPAVADALCELMERPRNFAQIRRHYLSNTSSEEFLRRLSEVLHAAGSLS